MARNCSISDLANKKELMNSKQIDSEPNAITLHKSSFEFQNTIKDLIFGPVD